MIALAEQFQRRVDLTTTSRALEALMLEDCPIPFSPKEQYFRDKSDPEQTFFDFEKFPRKELLNYLDSIDSQLPSDVYYAVTLSDTLETVRLRLPNGPVIKGLKACRDYDSS